MTDRSFDEDDLDAVFNSKTGPKPYLSPLAVKTAANYLMTRDKDGCNPQNASFLEVVLNARKFAADNEGQAPEEPPLPTASDLQQAKKQIGRLLHMHANRSLLFILYHAHAMQRTMAE